VKDPIEFFMALYDTALDADAAVELRALKNGGGFAARVFTQDQDEVRAFMRMQNAATPLGLYFGVALRKTGTKTGKKEDIHAVTALWADVDVVKLGWDMKLTLGALKQHELRPSVIVNSGYGYHLYWLLEKPLILSTDPLARRNEIELVENDMRALATVFSGDNTVDVTRVLRMPGSWNTKDLAKPKEVVVASADWRRWDWGELGEGAKNSTAFLAEDGWINKDELKKRTKAAKEAGDLMGTINLLTKEAGLKQRRFTSWAQIWQHVKYHGAGRGSAHIGLDEAILRATAYARVMQPHWTDDQVVTRTLEEVRLVKAKQAWGEKWDWDKERKEIEDKLARWNVRWKEICEQRSQEANAPRRKRR
jgi:hypothetical protein